MALVSMKQDSDGGNMACCVQSNPYGYGLTLCLSEEQVEALGLDKNPPGAGTQVGLRAVAIVQRVTQSTDTDGDDPAEVEVSISLQITDLEVMREATNVQASASLYSGNND